MENSYPSLDAPRPQGEAVTARIGGLIPGLPKKGILAGLSDRSLTNLAGYGRCHRFPAGTEIMREGEKQDRFYVVVSGELAISSRFRNTDIALNVAKEGECVGELNLLEPGPASATVRAETDAILWSMDIGELRTFLFEHSGGAGALLMGIAIGLSQRVRQANQTIAQNHALPVETLPAGRERAITADNTPIHPGLFDRLKQKIAGDKKIRISTKIKM
jgi:CRP-like cAMP-binding protein